MASTADAALSAGLVQEPESAPLGSRQSLGRLTLTPQPAGDRVQVAVAGGRGAPVQQLALPALGRLSDEDVTRMVRARARYAPLKSLVRALQLWRAPGALVAVARAAADVRGVGLRASWKNRRWWKDVGVDRLKFALGRGVERALPTHATSASSGHATALAALRAEIEAALPSPAPATQAEEAASASRNPADHASAEAWDSLFLGAADPWGYETSAYEQIKYADTLELAPAAVNALELGCAEGLFTEMLAPRVGRLLATDISNVALERARSRCAGHENVEFRQLDFATDDLPAGLDLIVCSEALYYLGARPRLERVLAKMSASLAPGGVLLMANANQVADEPQGSGYDWGAEFGSKTIGEVAADAGKLALTHEIRTPLYRVHRFVKPGAGPVEAPRLEDRPLRVQLEPEVAASALLQGGFSRARALHTERTSRVPILMYHRVAPDGPAELDRWRVTPELFAEHVELLRRHGFTSITPDDLIEARRTNRPLPGRPVMITFDDGYVDFAEHAWPILQRRGFSAVVFVVSGQVGGCADWDRAYGEPAPLLDWPELRDLRRAGVVIGSHSERHRPLTGLPTRDVYRELIASKRSIEVALGEPVTTFCYPHGDYDSVTEIALEECGYELGFSCSEGFSPLTEDPLALSRIEVAGGDGPEVLARKLRLAELPTA